MQFCRNMGTLDAHGSGGPGQLKKLSVVLSLMDHPESGDSILLLTLFDFCFDFDTCGSRRNGTYSFSLVVFDFWFLNAYTFLFYCSLQCTFILDLLFMWFAVKN